MNLRQSFQENECHFQKNDRRKRHKRLQVLTEGFAEKFANRNGNVVPLQAHAKWMAKSHKVISSAEEILRVRRRDGFCPPMRSLTYCYKKYLSST